MHRQSSMLGLGVKGLFFAAVVLSASALAADPPPTTTTTTTTTTTSTSSDPARAARALGEAQASLDTAKRDVDRLTGELTNLRAELAKLVPPTDANKADRDRLTADIAKTESELTTAKGRLDTATLTRDTVAQEVARLTRTGADRGVTGPQPPQPPQQPQAQQAPQVIVQQNNQEKKQQEQQEPQQKQQQAEAPKAQDGGGGGGGGMGNKPQNVTSEIAMAALQTPAKIAAEIGKNDVSKTLIEKPKDVGIDTNAKASEVAKAPSPTSKSADTLTKQISDGNALLLSSIKLSPIQPRGKTPTGAPAQSSATVGSALGGGAPILAVKKAPQLNRGRSPLGNNPVVASTGAKSGYVPTSRLLGFYNPAVEGSTRGSRANSTNRAIQPRRPASLRPDPGEEPGGADDPHHQQ